jgi:hypothetical protein
MTDRIKIIFFLVEGITDELSSALPLENLYSNLCLAFPEEY